MIVSLHSNRILNFQPVRAAGFVKTLHEIDDNRTLSVSWNFGGHISGNVHASAFLLVSFILRNKPLCDIFPELWAGIHYGCSIFHTICLALPL